MNFSWREFFKKGGFWTTLEESLEAIKNKQKQQSNNIRKLEQDNIVLANQLKYLTQENVDLKQKMAVLEERMWALNSSGRNEARVIEQVVDTSKKKKLKRPNKKLNKDAAR
jgi:ribosomal protein L21